MKITQYNIQKMVQEYKFMKEKERWNTCVDYLSQEQILKFGEDKIPYNEVYKHVLSKKRGEDE